MKHHSIYSSFSWWIHLRRLTSSESDFKLTGLRLSEIRFISSNSSSHVSNEWPIDFLLTSPKNQKSERAKSWRQGDEEQFGSGSYQEDFAPIWRHQPSHCRCESLTFDWHCFLLQRLFANCRSQNWDDLVCIRFLIFRETINRMKVIKAGDHALPIRPHLRVAIISIRGQCIIKTELHRVFQHIFRIDISLIWITGKAIRPIACKKPVIPV
jgi:hypothetical protein